MLGCRKQTVSGTGFSELWSLSLTCVNKLECEQCLVLLNLADDFITFRVELRLHNADEIAQSL